MQTKTVPLNNCSIVASHYSSQSTSYSHTSSVGTQYHVSYCSAVLATHQYCQFDLPRCFCNSTRRSLAGLTTLPWYAGLQTKLHRTTDMSCIHSYCHCTLSKHCPFVIHWPSHRFNNKWLTGANRHHHHHHDNEHNQILGLKTWSFKAQGVLGLSIFASVFPYPTVPEVGTGIPTWVGGLYPFVPGGLTISIDTVLHPLCCQLLVCYECQGFFGGPIL
jgi:hypothetical protein